MKRALLKPGVEARLRGWRRASSVPPGSEITFGADGVVYAADPLLPETDPPFKLVSYTFATVAGRVWFGAAMGYLLPS